MYWKPYVPVAKRRAAASRHAASSARKGRPLSPVVLSGHEIARSFWGKSWCEAMESYGDYANRLPRGRTYVRNGSVVDLRVEPGWIRAMVSGSSLYDTTVKVAPLAPARWAAVVEEHAGQVSSLVDLLQGRLPDSLLQTFCTRSSGLFPGPTELEFSCSCPDWATMCKHVAAVLYGVGARLDEDPSLLFLLRGVDAADLTARSAAVGFSLGAGEDDLSGVDLGDLFGIDLGAAPAAPATPAAAAKAPNPTPARTARKAPAAAKPAPAPAPQPRAPAPMAPISRADLDRYGVDGATVTKWLRAGVLLPTGAPGVYTPTDKTGPLLRAHIARRAGR